MNRRVTPEQLENTLRYAQRVIKNAEHLGAFLPDARLEAKSEVYTRKSLPFLSGVIFGGLTIAAATLFAPILSLGLLPQIMLSGVMTAVGIAVGQLVRRTSLGKGVTSGDRYLQGLYTLNEAASIVGERATPEEKRRLEDARKTLLTLYVDELIRNSPGLDPQQIKEARTRLGIGYLPSPDSLLAPVEQLEPYQATEDRPAVKSAPLNKAMSETT